MPHRRRNDLQLPQHRERQVRPHVRRSTPVQRTSGSDLGIVGRTEWPLLLFRLVFFARAENGGTLASRVHLAPPAGTPEQ